MDTSGRGNEAIVFSYLRPDQIGNGEAADYYSLHEAHQWVKSRTGQHYWAIVIRHLRRGGAACHWALVGVPSPWESVLIAAPDDAEATTVERRATVARDVQAAIDAAMASWPRKAHPSVDIAVVVMSYDQQDLYPAGWVRLRGGKWKFEEAYYPPLPR